MTPDPFDQYGSIIDAGWVEDAVEQTLRAWLPAHLAYQEHRTGRDPDSLPQPRSWPAVSDFDLQAHEQLPAIVIVSPGTTGAPQRGPGGKYRVTWTVEIAVALGDRTERGARRLAAVYLAAVKGALAQNRTLGGQVELCRYAGPDDHAFGPAADSGGQRAIYGTAFEVTVLDALNDTLGPAEPPEDPQNPAPGYERQDTAQITVTATNPEDTP